MSSEFRIEKDSLGELQVPVNAYYGVQTARAVANFPISGIRPHPVFVKAYVTIKRSAAVVHRDLKLLTEEQADAIIKAADEMLEGKLADQIVVDAYQAGAGTSTNMNVNEVLANRAAELLGLPRGNYSKISPNDHVNMAQSTNDSYPAAIRIGLSLKFPDLLRSVDMAINALDAKAKEFDDVIKSARTHLQDAVPIRLGQEFGGYASVMRRCKERLIAAEKELRQLNLGGTAAGTGMNAHPEYRARVAKEISGKTGIQFHPAENLFEVTQSLGDFLHFSSALRLLALELGKIVSDLRYLSSGPRTGLQEIYLPAVQPGSSIMPGKVNPSMAEMMNQVCYQVVGFDQTVAYCAQAGQMDLNVMMPVVNYNLQQSLHILETSIEVFTKRCIEGITVDRERCKMYFESSVGMATIMNPYIGYLKAAELAKESVKTGKSIVDLIREHKLLTEEQMKEILEPRRLTDPDLQSAGAGGG
ncbi:MAG: aspartate ammonia-lyase [Calditrichaeota bacterium]|nr:aspartate ammonia-lyase [Calditrichota bacterium]MCB9368842.1 aspartate ammonia-lyase [Calditrichota bacterium]